MPTAATARLEDYFTPQEIARALAYRGPHYLFVFASLGLGLAILGLLAFGPRPRREWARGWAWRTLAWCAVVVAVPAVARLGLAVASWRHDRRFGLATNTLSSFLADVGKVVGFRFVFTALGALAFIGVARRLPRAWPIVVAVAGAALTVALVFLLPVVYEPAFNRFTPVDASTRARVVTLAQKAGVRIEDVLVADASRRTTAQNAYVSGIGSTKRVVLYDTLLREPPERVDLVVAHELAHDKHGDVPRGTAIAAGGVVAGVAVLWWLLRNARARAAIGASGAGDPRVVPFLVLYAAVATFATLPLQNWISRGIEARADRTAIALTGEPQGQIELQVVLARRGLDDLQPNAVVRWIFFSHPTTLERIQIALDAER